MRIALSREDAAFFVSSRRARRPDPFILWCRSPATARGDTLGGVRAAAALLGRGAAPTDGLPLPRVQPPHAHTASGSVGSHLTADAPTACSRLPAMAAARSATVQGQTGEDLPELARSISSPGYTPTPTKRSRSQRRLDTSKYVGLSSKNLIGMSRDDGLYMA